MRKKIRLFSLAVLLAFSMAACGDEAPKENTDGGNVRSQTDGQQDAGNPSDSDAETGMVVGFEEEQNQILVTLSTDKDKYKDGEIINFSLDLVNNNPGLTVVSSQYSYSGSKNLMPATEEKLPTLVPRLRSGESASLAGQVTKTDGSRELPTQTIQTGAGDYITVRPYVQIPYGDDTLTLRMVLNLKVVQVTQTFESSQYKKLETTSCHDPSIFKDFDGTYYVFGTHIGMSSSADLHNWTNRDTEFRATFTEENKDKIREWNLDSGEWYGYLWAPDVVYNPVLSKYCMYLSADGDNWISNIVLLTADAAAGPYDYAGTVVYGGFTDETFTQTDAPQVLGTDTIPDRYIKNGVANKKWGDKFPNCIDPCVFYDENGNLWMSYGSWSGGIFMIELDENTGLRDYAVSYETDNHSDAYFGKKIAGGCYVSGEASYIQHIGEYYYLFISYGGLSAKEGYNIRVFRSEKPDGPYTDALGKSSLYDSYVQNFNQSVGVRLFGAYQWRSMTTGEVAQGHNSAFVDDDGKAYIVFHTRTTNGTEAHYVKVHQLFVNEDGWIVAAPYFTDGETLNEKGYSREEVAGTYDVILHQLNVAYAKLDTNKPVTVTLGADGKISGAYEGEWSLAAGTPYITLTIDGVNYKGVALKMNIEKTSVETMVFTLLGDSNQLTLWGSKSVE